MKSYIENIEERTQTNEHFREVLYTSEHLQLVVMSLAPGEDIGAEVHQLDQFIRVESGEGKAVLDGEESSLADGVAVIIPAGVHHNIINTSSAMPLKLYTLYGPPNHPVGTIHHNKAEADAAEAEAHGAH